MELVLQFPLRATMVITPMYLELHLVYNALTSQATLITLIISAIMLAILLPRVSIVISQIVYRVAIEIPVILMDVVL